MRTLDPLSTDWAVLSRLESNGRASYARIGRDLGMSKERVKRSAERLKVKGVVTQYSAVVNITRLGFTPYVTYVQLISCNEKMRHNILRKLCTYRDIYWVSRMGGKFDLLFALAAPSIRVFAIRLSEIQAEFDGKFGKLAINTRLQTIQFPRNYLAKRAPSRTSTTPAKPLSFGKDFDATELSEVDTRLINVLAVNARLPATLLARELSLPRTTVQRHLRRLEQAGIIQGYVANVQVSTLGYETYRLLLMTANRRPQLFDEIYEFARKSDHVTYIDFGIGEWDIELTCEVRRQQDLQKILLELRSEFADRISLIELLPIFEDNVKFQFAV